MRDELVNEYIAHLEDEMELDRVMEEARRMRQAEMKRMLHEAYLRYCRRKKIKARLAGAAVMALSAALVLAMLALIIWK